MTREDGWAEDATAEIADALGKIRNLAGTTPAEIAEAGRVLLFWGRELAGLSPAPLPTTPFARELAMR